MRASLTRRGGLWVAAWSEGRTRCEYASPDRTRSAALLAEMTGVVLWRAAVAVQS